MRLVCLLLLAVQWNGLPLRCMATAKASSRTATPLKPSPLLTRTRAGQSDWKLRLQGVSLDTVVTTNTSCVVVAALVLHSGKTEYGVDVPVASDVGERGGSLPLQCGGADGDSMCGLIDSGASHVYGPLSARLAVHRYLASHAKACYDTCTCARTECTSLLRRRCLGACLKLGHGFGFTWQSWHHCSCVRGTEGVALACVRSVERSPVLSWGSGSLLARTRRVTPFPLSALPVLRRCRSAWDCRPPVCYYRCLRTTTGCLARHCCVRVWRCCCM